MGKLIYMLDTVRLMQLNGISMAQIQNEILDRSLVKKTKDNVQYLKINS